MELRLVSDPEQGQKGGGDRATAVRSSPPTGTVRGFWHRLPDVLGRLFQVVTRISREERGQQKEGLLLYPAFTLLNKEHAMISKHTEKPEAVWEEKRADSKNSEGDTAGTTWRFLVSPEHGGSADLSQTQ